MSKLVRLLIVAAALCAAVVAGVLIGDDDGEPGEVDRATSPPTTETEAPPPTTPPTTGRETAKGEDPQALRRLASIVAGTGDSGGRRGSQAAVADQLRYLTVLDESSQTLSVAAYRVQAVARGHRVRRSAAIPQRRRLAPIVSRLRDAARRLREQDRIAATAAIAPQQRARVARHRTVLIEVLGAAAEQLDRQRALPGLTRAELRVRARRASRTPRVQRRLALQRGGRIAQRTSVQLQRTARQMRVGLKLAVRRAATRGEAAGRRALRRLHEMLASLPPGWPMFPPLGG
jgi:hypothetical protein